MLFPVELRGHANGRQVSQAPVGPETKEAAGGSRPQRRASRPRQLARYGIVSHDPAWRPVLVSPPHPPVPLSTRLMQVLSSALTTLLSRSSIMLSRQLTTPSW